MQARPETKSQTAALKREAGVSRLPIGRLTILVALLAGLYMLLMRATACTATRLLFVGRRCLLRVVILVALLASLDVLFVGSTLGSHDISPRLCDETFIGLGSRTVLRPFGSRKILTKKKVAAIPITVGGNAQQNAQANTSKPLGS